jgi:hypothetical protein
MRLFRRHRHVWVFDHLYGGFLFERCECGAERIQDLEDD